MKMRTISILLLSMIIVSNEAIAQDKESDSNPEVALTINNDSADAGQPLYSLHAENKKYEFSGEDNEGSTLKQINPDWIEAISVYKDEAAIERYGEKANNGVIVIELKNGYFKSMPRDLRKQFKKTKPGIQGW